MKKLRKGHWPTTGMVAVVTWLLAACAAPPIVHAPSTLSAAATKAMQSDVPRRLVVFLDGTANAEGSYTNVARLRNLVTLQARPDLYTVYIEGVGANGNLLGLAMGSGIGQDVRHAYRFVWDHYRPGHGDTIDLFGFSRGAYAARILAGMLQVVGLPAGLATEPADRMAWVETLYSAYKNEGSVAQRRERVAAVLGQPLPAPVAVRFAGLWDTVEALGVPDYAEDVQRPNPRYIDQMCNVAEINHALAADDDRARIFTPILFTAAEVARQCGDGFHHQGLRQVWFSGAHADMGGGYPDGFLSGVSLNWMLDRYAPYGLLPPNTRVLADAWGLSHQPDRGAWGLIYHRQSRALDRYARLDPRGRLTLHRSVLDRLATRAQEPYELDWLARFPTCFVGRNGALVLREVAVADPHCFTVEGGQ